MNPTTLPAATASLWAKLEALDLDGAGALSFSKRLARDNGWPPAFAQRVVLEYKKFVYLAATCGHPVTPSDEVDQAWHLHLVYTRSYWNELCEGILGFPLHHGTTQGGAAEGQKFTNWYARTLASYRVAFSEAPPADIWPSATVRFGEAPHFRRLNVRRKWVITKPRLPLGQLLQRGPGLLATGLLLVLIGCTARTPLNPFDWYGPEFLTLYWLLCGTLLPLALWWRHQARGPLVPYAGPWPTPYALARLADRGQAVANSALATLAYRGQLELLPNQHVRRTGAAGSSHPYEQAVWRLVPAAPKSVALSAVRNQALADSLPALRSLDASLEQQGLLLPPTERQRLNRWPWLMTLALGAFGLAKVAVGISRDRPVGLLLLTLLALVLATALAGWHLRAWSTGQGEHVLHTARATARQQHLSHGASDSLVTSWVALFGLAELKYLNLATIADLLAPPPIADGGSSDGSDGDSGCGGCGGCGGGD